LRVHIFALMMSFALFAGAQATEISFNEGTNFGLSVSPDGLTLAMDLQGILWTVPAAGGTATPLTSGQQPEAREPSFSPDGAKIAFHGFHGGYFHIWTVNVDGSDLQQITSGSYDDREPSWNMDGETFVFSSDRDGTYDIWEINLATGRETKLTNNPDDDAHPHKSPDGKRLLHTREIKNRYSEIVLVEYDRNEKSEHSLMKSDSTKYIRPAWNNDGTGFSYISHTSNDIKLHYVKDAYSLEAQFNSIILDQGDIFPFRASWGLEGIYFTADGQIKYRPLLTNERRGNITVEVGEITKVAFEATITANPPNYIRKPHDFDRTGSEQVMGVGSMDISTKRDQMVFTALGDMWLQSGDAMAENIASEAGHIIDPTWSRDGELLAFVAEKDGQMDIWIRNMTTGNDRQLTNDKNREYRLTWSRDGKSIAYLSTRGTSNTWGRSDLKVIDVAFGNINTVDKTIFTPGRPAWSLDGKNIIMAVVKPATTRFREGMHALRQYNLESGRSKLLDMPGNIGLSTRDGSGPVMSPDGAKMAYISEGEVRVTYVSRSGEINGTVDNRCVDTAQMPRWSRDSDNIYYLSGKTLKSCNTLNGQTEDHKFNLTWARKIANDKTIHVEKFFDGVSKEYRENVDVFISGNRISKIVPHGQDPVIGTFVDYSRDTMIPGLMAGHSHQTELLGEKLGRNWLAYGITSVRDPGSNPYKSIERKETWASGKSLGPRLFHGGWLTGGARIYYGQSYNAINEKALRHELQRVKELDYDMIKSYVRLPDEFQQILIEEGHKLGIPLSSHEIAPAVQNGMDSVEHLAATSRRGYSPKSSSLSIGYQDVVNIISQSGLTITPTATLTTGYNIYAAEYPEYLSDIKYRTFLDEMQRDGLSRRLNSVGTSPQSQRNPSVLKSIKTMHDMGANIAAGTDTPFMPYGIAEHFEIIQYVDAGLSPYDAIRASTINVAKNIGVDGDLGTLEVGKIADMVIIDGDPLNEITDIRNVEATIKDGHIYQIRELTKNRGE
jgi:Tol biopolymer transport system component/imidazolonepropionase-like amidohydrolase